MSSFVLCSHTCTKWTNRCFHKLPTFLNTHLQQKDNPALSLQQKNHHLWNSIHSLFLFFSNSESSAPWSWKKPHSGDNSIWPSETQNLYAKVRKGWPRKVKMLSMWHSFTCWLGSPGNKPFLSVGLVWGCCLVLLHLPVSWSAVGYAR